MTNAPVDDIAPQLIELLAWYGEAGADCVLDDARTDWLARGREGPGAEVLARLRARQAGGVAERPATALPAQSAERPSAARPAGMPVQHDAARTDTRQPAGGKAPAATTVTAPPVAVERRFPAVPPDAAEAAARRLAAAAADLDALRRVLVEFDGCALKATAKSLCFYRGAAQARLMIIGEPPGRDEDVEGRPLTGRAGRLLDRMLAAIGFGEADVHITNVVYWRPPGNRTPTAQETLVCRPFLERQIALVAPAVILALGGAAANSLLGGDQGIVRIRGRWQSPEIAGEPRRIMPSLHPAYLLLTPAQKRLAWRDLLAVKQALTLS